MPDIENYDVLVIGSRRGAHFPADRPARRRLDSEPRSRNPAPAVTGGELPGYPDGGLCWWEAPW